MLWVLHSPPSSIWKQNESFFIKSLLVTLLHMHRLSNFNHKTFVFFLLTMSIIIESFKHIQITWMWQLSCPTIFSFPRWLDLLISIPCTPYYALVGSTLLVLFVLIGTILFPISFYFPQIYILWMTLFLLEIVLFVFGMTIPHKSNNKISRMINLLSTMLGMVSEQSYLSTFFRLEHLVTCDGMPMPSISEL